MRGDELPKIVHTPPGPQSQLWLNRLAQAETPGLTLPGGVVWSAAQGSCVEDVDGNRYIDMSAAFGVASIGHRHPAVVAAVAHQSAQLMHGMGDVFAHPTRVELVECLKALAPIQNGRVFLAGGGSEAVEIALKSAALYTGKSGILAWSGAYHGLTFGALAPTSREAFRTPFRYHLSPHISRAPYPYAYRWQDSSDPLAASLELAEQQLKAASSMPIGAVIVEPIQGREGEIVPPIGWLQGLRELCDRYEVLLIVDEIFTGWGRTGFRWAVDAESVQPDLICIGKSMTGGLPLAACIGRTEIMQAWQVDGEPLHTATFMGNPVNCAAALATITVLEQADIYNNVAKRGASILQVLQSLQAAYPIIGDIRGRGFMLGLELVTNQVTKEPASHATMQLVSYLQQYGVLALGGGMYGNVLSLTPPFVITDAQLGYVIDVLEHGLAHICKA